MRLLNVGCGGKNSKIPPWFDGWDVVRLDIDPKVEPDLLMDARGISSLDACFDAVFCSHNLEHYDMHDAGIVVRGMYHVLNEHGFADVVVPNIGLLLKQTSKTLDLDTFLYHSHAGPISVRDLLYGYERQREFSNHPEYMLHRNGFSGRTLSLLLKWCDFGAVYTAEMGWDLRAVGFKREPGIDRLASIGLELVE